MVDEALLKILYLSLFVYKLIATTRGNIQRLAIMIDLALTLYIISTPRLLLTKKNRKLLTLILTKDQLNHPCCAV